VFVLSFFAWCIRWSFATVVFLAVMAGAGWYVVNNMLAGGEHVTVPNIVDMPISNATTLLLERGLEMGTPMTQQNEAVPRNHVISQRPPAGTVVRTGRRVVPTVSVGPEAVPVGNVVGKVQDQAVADITREGMFKVGTRARIYHSAPRDTVIAQDPPPNAQAPAGAEIHLLISDGGAGRTSFMPNLIDLPMQDVVRILAPYKVNARVLRVDRPEAPFDVVLDQSPPAGTRIQEGEDVTYSVRAPQVTLRTQPAEYVVPPSAVPREVRIDVVDKDGQRRTIFPREKDYVDGQPPRYESGTELQIPAFEYEQRIRTEIFLDGQRVRAFEYIGAAPPTVTDYPMERRGTPGA
jgi:eukaryotic-like serine/threonine-protein kinase